MEVHEGLENTKDEAEILYMAETQQGIITSTQVTEAGIPRRCLTSMVRSGLLVRVERGVYTLPETWEDELFILQWRFSRGIFSHETALYLHAMTDRTPSRYTMTFPFGYNPVNVIKRGVLAKVANEETYPLGIMTLASPSGNSLKVYDIERTLCDMVRTRHKADIQVVNQAMRMYAGSREKDIGRLMDYAQRLLVKQKILTYLDILL
ncbi:MAG: type IV toxin-antitoxin system AbiEi family antitoxin domain-containing protein [Sphaerochaetaceae bacterium]|jgi:predicted transcriptional regulator of viral defense system|nr:type IV toxin-antitoxin system AbiEi family antitoxin domain-containing protein [Sphaerochaetaceae bacterium]